MDLHAIRTAFAFAHGLAERVRIFCAMRLVALRDGRGPIAMVPGPALATHVIPVASRTGPRQYTIEALKAAAAMLQHASPANDELRTPKANLEGVVCAGDIREPNNLHYAYAQLFRDGCIELPSTFAIAYGKGDRAVIFPSAYERPLVHTDLPVAFATLTALDTPTPVYLSVSWLDVGGLRVAPHERLNPNKLPTPRANQREISSLLRYVDELTAAPAEIAGPAIDIL